MVVERPGATAQLDDGPAEKSPALIGNANESYGSVEGKARDSELKPATSFSFGIEASTQEDRKNEQCSWGPMAPLFCQDCRNAKVVLFCLCIAATVQGMVVNGFINVCISTLELRYDLTSTQAGLIVSSYDIASVVCLIPVTYYGGFGRKPHWLGIGMAILGLGNFVFALPQFTTDDYKYGNVRQDPLCHRDMGITNSTDTCTGGSVESLSGYQFVFILANVLNGVGASPLYTLGVTYLDENLSGTASPFYIGIYYAMSIVGPAIGYLLGGYFLTIYVDFTTVDTDNLSIDIDNPNWVGAWWIGFLLSGLLAVTISLPLCGFPKDLPGSQELRSKKESQAYKGSDVATSREDFGMTLKDIPSSLKILLLNPTFMMINLAAASEGIIVAGFSAFAPKFIESEYSITASWAATLVGFVAIPCGGGGMLLGGYLIKKKQLKFRGMIRLCLVTVAIAFCGALGFLFGCENVNFAGVNVDYLEHNSTLSSSNMTASCNVACNCLQDWYTPVCSASKIMYFSPCHAGCINSTEDDEDFYLCSCIALDESVQKNALLPAATAGTCESGCSMELALFLLLFGLTMLATFTTAIPALSATLRCVPDKQRSFALGIQWIFARCLGTIPSPILFGVIIDQACLLWEEACDESGSCYFYDNFDMSFSLMALALSVKAMSFIFFFLALFLYRPPEILDDDIPKTSPAGVDTFSSDQSRSAPAQPAPPEPSNQRGVSNPALSNDEEEN